MNRTTLLALAFVGLSNGTICAQSFAAIIMWFNDGQGAFEAPLADWCVGGTPFADGSATVQIYWDSNSNGPDVMDLLAPLCPNPPDCPEGSVNFNQFLTNGSEYIGEAGYFITDVAFTSIDSVPNPAHYYLEVRHGNLMWRSSVFSLVAGFQEVGPGTDIPLTFDCCLLMPPPPISNVSASDSACDGIHITWDYPDTTTAVDSIFIYRDELNTPFGQVGISDPDVFTDFTVVPGWSYIYYVVARRECGDQDSLMSVPVVDFGRRAFLPPIPQSMSASDDQVDQVTISWTYATNIGLDTWYIKRNGILLSTVPGGGPPGQRDFVDVSPLNIAAHYTVTGASVSCGEGDSAGDWGASSGVAVNDGIVFPSEFALHGSFPNPFNSVTTIIFALARPENVHIVVYDVTGAELAVLVKERMTAGMHTISFEASQLASGVYFVRMKAGIFSQTHKIVLLK